MDVTPPESGWLIPYIIAVLGALGTVLASFFKGLKSPEKPDHRILTAEIADTNAVATKIVRDLAPKLERILSLQPSRDRKIDEILAKLQNIENEQEIARRARDEVQRQLLERRENDRWRMSPEK